MLHEHIRSGKQKRHPAILPPDPEMRMFFGPEDFEDLAGSRRVSDAMTDDFDDVSRP